MLPCEMRRSRPISSEVSAEQAFKQALIGLPAAANIRKQQLFGKQHRESI